MSSTPTTVVPLQDLITQFEQAGTALSTADGVLDTASQKLAAAQSTQQDALSKDVSAINDYNAVADQVAAAILASKRTPPVA